MKIRDWFGNDVEVKIVKMTYANGNMAIKLMSYDEEYNFWEPYATLTVNFDEKLPENMAYVDTNNVPTAEEFIEKYGLGEHQGSFKFSGFCCYPLYKFY